MGRYCQLVVGPAGSGKSTYCSAILQHLLSQQRHRRSCSPFVVNLDPAAEKFQYEPQIDIRDLITVDDVMDELQLGPNGSLLFCLEYLVENMDWFEEQLGTEWEDEYMLIDCPGQIELFTHSHVMQQFIHHLQHRLNFRVCVVHVLESQFITDTSKFVAGVLTAMSAMIHLHVPHINVMTKMDLVEGRPGEMDAMRSRLIQPDRSDHGDGDDDDDELDNEYGDLNNSTTSKKNDTVVLGVGPTDNDTTLPNTWSPEEELERDHRRSQIQLPHYLSPDPHLLLTNLNKSINRPEWMSLNESIVRLIDDYNMVAFMPLNVYDEESMDELVMAVDHAIQFGEDEEPREPKEWEPQSGDEGDDDDGGYGDGEYVAENAWREILQEK